jgi:hypothetical protein
MSLVFEHILQYLPSNKNKAIETTIGPIVVPNARFNYWMLNVVLLM